MLILVYIVYIYLYIIQEVHASSPLKYVTNANNPKTNNI